MRVNIYAVFNDTGEYMHILETVKEMKPIESSMINKAITPGEYEQYLQVIREGRIPQLSLETQEVEFVEPVKEPLDDEAG